MRKNRNAAKRLAIEAVVEARNGTETSAISMVLVTAFSLKKLEEMKARLLSRLGAVMPDDVYTPAELQARRARMVAVAEAEQRRHSPRLHPRPRSPCLRA